ncbi:MAG: hypothetical protein KME28_13125 [Pelatocladus maniniholoensis HA4357-MV3]|jgi:hypothetical protein|uniref:Uncharacterized protein n=1 Tax=Pelatocladus maniniholoensis HA4357-MV3 TaxID=1117104 RepID=A0A9E3H948_9NOST|nr:hypothetical protein [Pelatocladus maniniholoensis HA4357-MV3]BAZ65554.1 hypothetical protein NIES4106_02930 [Fischerella sp. NIES-4106]
MLNKRLNYNIPADLTPQIRLLADQDGVTPAYWLRKALEEVVRERLSGGNFSTTINLSNLEAFNND